MTVPFIPESAPFTPEQRAWLNGFFAGLYAAPETASAPSRNTAPFTIVVLSQTGTGDVLARTFAKDARARGGTAKILRAEDARAADIARFERLLVIASTHGDGEPPDGARPFFDELQAADAPRFERTRFAVLALGDSSYARFAQCGRDIDARLEALGASRAVPCVEADVAVDEPFARWRDLVFAAFTAPGETATTFATPRAVEDGVDSPVSAGRVAIATRVVSSHRLTGESSSKDVRHVALAADSPALAYTPGDAIGVLPRNDMGVVDEVLRTLRLDGSREVCDNGEQVRLGDLLRERRTIGRLVPKYVRELAKRTNDSALLALTRDPSALRTWCEGRELIDLVETLPAVFDDAESALLSLPTLAPRLYSIASSPAAHRGELHLTVGSVRYAAHGRERRGTCSHYLSLGVSAGEDLHVFIQPNERFRLAADDRPIVMIGPGTGIAPFRSFIAEREMRGARGRTWLFFGDRNAASDQLYSDELRRWKEIGVLRELDVVFSRDGTSERYVQHRMRARSRELYAWLEDGAVFYVCGDASAMAKDVETALHDVIAQYHPGGETGATRYLAEMRRDGRYLRDVY